MAILIKKKCAVDAVEILYPNKYIVAKENGLVTWKDGHETTPEETTAINAKIVELQAEYDAQEYARNRAAEYPSIAELTVALYDTDDKAAIDAKRAAVKAKYPKPS